MINQRPLYQMLGIAKRAGLLVAGNDVVLRMLRSGAAKLIIIATDIAPYRCENMLKMCEEQNILVFCFGVKVELGKAIGKPSCVLLAITDMRFAEAIYNKWQIARDNF